MSALLGIGNVNTCDNKTRLLSFRAAVDCLLATSNLCTVTPIFFALNFLSSVLPGGCYTSIRNWFSSITTNKIVCPKNKDLVTFFDNNQVLARNWRVRYDRKQN